MNYHLCKSNNKRLDSLRKIMIEYSSINYDVSHNVVNNLSWIRYINRVNRVIKELPKGVKILEVGCGWGHISAMLKILRPDLKVVGSDIEKSEIWNKLKSFGCSYVKCDAKNLPFDDCEFYAVISFGVMEHVENDDKFLREIYRVLKKGGHNFIFDLPNMYGFSETILGGVVGCISNKKLHRHKVRYGRNKVKTLLINHGFKIVEIKNEFLLPAQVSRISKSLFKFFNEHYLVLNKVDKILTETPLALFAQTLSIHCIKT